MQRYTIPFKDNRNRAYDVRVYVNGYSGKTEELTGAESAFTVEGSDEEFVYTPVRLSSATLSVLDSRLLTDLFSPNTQNVQVKLYEGSTLCWTGYVSPEQFTQPYKPNPDVISIDCVSAMSTLEHIPYVRQTEDGFISMTALLRYLVASAKGGYRHVYVPHVYGTSQADYTSGRSALDGITLSEGNFTEGEMTLDEVLECVCTFFAWTLYDYEGSLYFVDPDWAGDYREYDEGLTTYHTFRPNQVDVHQVGFAGSDHTIDVLPGYNKCLVKSINNVFDEPVKNEDYDILKMMGTWRGVVSDLYDWKEFVHPMHWKVFAYDKSGMQLDDPSVVLDGINNVFGAVLMREAYFEADVVDGEIVPRNSDIPWTDCVQLRCKGEDGTELFNKDNEGTRPILQYKGEPAVWKDGALGINFGLQIRISREMQYKGGLNSNRGLRLWIDLTFSLRIGNKWWNGKGWQTGSCKFKVSAGNNGMVDLTQWVSCKTTKTVGMPYRNLSGYIIELPKDEILWGDIELTLYNFRCGPLQIEGLPAEFGDIQMYGQVLKDLKLSYRKRDDVKSDGEDGDRVYENVVNDSFLNDTDEIEFGIGSYNEDGATYSKALMDGKFLTDNLYSAVEGKAVRPEEAFIRRVVNRYKSTHVRLTQVLKNSLEVHPFSVLSDKSMVSNKFMVQSWVRDYEQNTMHLSMVDNGRRD